MAQGNDFDFKAFNTLTERIPAGLQIFLAIQMLDTALWQFHKYENRREGELSDIVDELKQLRKDYKADAEKRANAG
jgi:hypothetical protein